MARGVEDVDLDILVVETHDRRCDRDAALALDLHEIGRGALLYLVALDGSGHMYGPAEEEQFLGKGSLSRIGVRKVLRLVISSINAMIYVILFRLQR